jgi:EAL domain-containing protein (putative c-di-GMP-specific phosphodiesterase class I)
VVFPEASAEIEVARMLNEFYQRCFGAAFATGTEELRVTARIGVALFPADGGDTETLYRNAEAAVKRAKSAVERVLFYDARMTESIAEKLALENRLRGALQNEQFVLHYQPKVDCVSRRVEGVEALIRWHDPELGLVPPAKFIPLMEETGLIVEVGAWALHKAASDYRAWRTQGLDAPRIAVNVSAIQLQRKDFVSNVEAALRSDGAVAGIDLEITESAILTNVEDTVGKLHALRAQGLNLAIDDFGTGYSSLSYLAKLPVQVLKIDQSFVSTMLADPDSQTLVATMISLAHALRMKVVAEGVETEEQAALLKLLRCDVIQGYLIGKPMPDTALLGWLNVAPHRAGSPR